MSLRKAGVYAAQLPRGARVYEEAGDDRAVSQEWLLLRLVEFDLQAANYQRAGNKGAQPKAEKLPSEQHAESTAAAAKRERAEQARARHLARAKAQRRT